MTAPGSDPDWLPIPIRTARLVLRKSEARDRAGMVELFSSPKVGMYIGGARSRSELDQTVPQVPGRRPGFFVVEFDGGMIGVVTFDHRGPDRIGRVRPEGGEAELGYLFLPHAWGHGFAAEACVAGLGWFARTHPGEPVVLTTQAANQRAMSLADRLGFREVERFEEWDAEQWFGVCYPDG